MRLCRTENQWRKTFDKFDRSGLTQEQFRQREGLALATFASWRRKLRTVGLATIPAGFVEVCLLGQTPPAEPAAPDPAELVVEVPYRVVLRFRGMRP